MRLVRDDDYEVIEEPTAEESDRITAPEQPDGALDAYVDQMGQIVWTWAADAPDRTAKGIVIEEP